MNITVFPHSALTPREAYPRITSEQAAEVLAAIEAYNEAHPGSRYGEATPAIVIAVFAGSTVKYLVNENEAADTIKRLREAP